MWTSVVLLISLVIVAFVSCCDSNASINQRIDCLTKAAKDSISDSALIRSGDANFGTVYDSALAAIVFSKLGADNIARKITNTLTQLVQLDGLIYSNIDVEQLMPLDNTIRTRDIAFAALAFINMYEQTPEYKYLRSATALMGYIEQNLKSPQGGYVAGESEDWRSAEQCVVVYAAAKRLLRITKDEQYSAMMEHAKKHLDYYAPNTLGTQQSELTQQMTARVYSWYLLTEENQQTISRVVTSLQGIGPLLANPNTAIEPDAIAALTMALYQIKRDKSVFQKYTLDHVATAHMKDKLWALLMLSYVNGNPYANPFNEKVTYSRKGGFSPQQEELHESGSNAVRTGLIIAGATVASVFLFVATVVLCVFLPKKLRGKSVDKQDAEMKRIKIKPHIKNIDMRAVASPLSPVDESMMFSPSTPNDPYSPVSQLYRDQYHIVSPATPSYDEHAKLWSPKHENVL